MDETCHCLDCQCMDANFSPLRTVAVVRMTVTQNQSNHVRQSRCDGLYTALETVTKRGELGGIKRHCSIIRYGSSLYEFRYKSPLRRPVLSVCGGCCLSFSRPPEGTTVSVGILPFTSNTKRKGANDHRKLLWRTDDLLRLTRRNISEPAHN